MKRTKIKIKRIVSPDGKVVAEARSVTSVSSDNESVINNSVTVEIGSSSCSSYSYTSTCQEVEFEDFF